MGRSLNPPIAKVRELTIVAPTAKGGTGANNAIDAATNIGAISTAALGAPGGLASLNNFARIPQSALPASTAPSATLAGERTLYLNQVATYTISNYDAATEYSVSASAGIVTRSGAVITYTAPGVAGNYTLTVNGRAVTIAVTAVRPNRPVLAATSTGTNLSAALDVTGSTFSMQTGAGTHASTDWEVSATSDFSSLYSSLYNDAVRKTALSLAGLGLNTVYYVRARYRDATGQVSDWSATARVATKSNYIPTLEEAKLVAPAGETTNTTTENTFYTAVALDQNGTRVAVGSWSAQPTSGGVLRQGRVYVFVRSGSTWTLEQSLAHGDPAAGDFLGMMVAMDSTGTRVVSGTYNKSGTYSGQGAAYVFVRNTTTNVWTQEAKIAHPNPQAVNEYFGWSASLSGDGARLAISAEGKSTATGVVYVFARTGSTWALEATITHPETQTNSYFGVSLAMTADSTRMVVGAYLQTVSGAAGAGSAYVFVRNTTTNAWTLESSLPAGNPAANAYFGGAVSISQDGSRAVVGAKQATVNGFANAGAVYVFSRSGSTWTREQILTASDAAASSNFGTSLAISPSGAVVLVGANYADPSGRSNAGSAYVFTRVGSSWTETRILSNSDSAANQGLGTSVTFSGDDTRVAVISANRATSTFQFMAAYMFVAG